MSNNKLKAFEYKYKSDYDKKVRINGEDVAAYSKKCLDTLYPDKNYPVIGETFENKKRETKKDIGKIELADKTFLVVQDKEYSEILRKKTVFFETAEGEYIALLKLRLLPVILLAGIFIALLCLCGTLIFNSFENTASTVHSEPVTQSSDVKSTTKATETESGTKENGSETATKATETEAATKTKEAETATKATEAESGIKENGAETAAKTTEAEAAAKATESEAAKEADPYIEPVKKDTLSVSGTVTAGGKALSGATVRLMYKDDIISDIVTGQNGKYELEVNNGVYNLVFIYKDSTVTKGITVDNKSLSADFDFPEGENTGIKALVKLNGVSTPAVSVGGLDEEVFSLMIRDKNVNLTLLAEQVAADEVPESDQNNILQLSGELDLTYFDFSLLKEIFSNGTLENTEYLKKSNNVLEIAVAHDSTRDADTCVFRCHENVSQKFEKLEIRPESNFKDGTFYVSSDTVYIYTNCFSTYAVGSASGTEKIKGSDVITYSSLAEIHLKTNKISMLYAHDTDSTNNAKVQIYLEASPEDYLIAESGIIPPGYKIETIDLLESAVSVPKSGTYKGFMRILYYSGDGNTVMTHTDIELTVSVAQ